MDIYEQLRTIGVSIETADALAPVLEKMPKRKQDAFLYWAGGMCYKEIQLHCGISRHSMLRVVKRINRAICG